MRKCVIYIEPMYNTVNYSSYIHFNQIRIMLNVKGQRHFVETEIIFYDSHCIVSSPYIFCDLKMAQQKGRNMSSA